MKCVCDWCGSELNRSPSRLKSHIFCARRCYDAWQRRTDEHKKQVRERYRENNIEKHKEWGKRAQKKYDGTKRIRSHEYYEKKREQNKAYYQKTKQWKLAKQRERTRSDEYKQKMNLKYKEDEKYREKVLEASRARYFKEAYGDFEGAATALIELQKQLKTIKDGN